MPRGEELTAHGRFLRALARSLVAPADQEDLVQDAWARALAHPPRHDAAPRAWLARILRRRAHAHGAREAERAEREATAFHARPAARSDDPAAIAAELELSRRVLEAVERLREPYRSTLYLRYYRGHAPERIAAESATPVKTVKARLARGLEELRGELDRLHDGDRRAWVALLLPLAQAAPPVPLDSAPPARLAPLGLALGGALFVAASAAALFLLDAAFGEEPRPEAVGDVRRGVEPTERPAPVAGSAATRREAVLDAPPAPAERDERIRLRGRLLDERGDALAGVEVRVTALAREFRAPRGLARAREDAAELATVASTGEGAFELVLAEPGPIRVGCERDGFAPLGRRLLVFAGQELDLGTLVLEPGLRLSGRVTDEHGLALAGAELWQPRRDEGLDFGLDERWYHVATSDARGEFTLARLAAGEWRLEARAEEHVAATASGVLVPGGGEPALLELVLPLGSAIEGTVVGLAPEELARARVLARSGAEGSKPPRAVLPAADGGFRLGGLAPDAELELFLVQGEGHELRRGAGLAARAGERGLVLVARPEEPERRARGGADEAGALARGRLEVLVRGEDGRPAAGALVLLATPGRPRSAPEVRAADREGRVHFDELAAGPHELATVSGVFDPHLETAAGRLAVSVAAGETTHAELRALLLGRLSGQVRVQGEPLAGAEVRVRPLGSDDARRGPSLSLLVRSDGDGRFSSANLPPGIYALELTHAALVAAHTRALEVRAGPNELRLELATGELTGRVLDAAGRALAGARFFVAGEEAAGPPRTHLPLASSDARGEFVLAGLDLAAPPALTLEADGHATLALPRVEPGVPVEYRLQPEVELALEVRGARAPWLRLVARGPGGVRRVVGLAAGTRTSLHGLGAGVWTFAVFAPERSQRSSEPLGERTLELALGEPRELVLELP